jgi:hypothetical protein
MSPLTRPQAPTWLADPRHSATPPSLGTRALHLRHRQMAECPNAASTPAHGPWQSIQQPFWARALRLLPRACSLRWPSGLALSPSLGSFLLLYASPVGQYSTPPTPTSAPLRRSDPNPEAPYQPIAVETRRRVHGAGRRDLRGRCQRRAPSAYGTETAGRVTEAAEMSTVTCSGGNVGKSTSRVLGRRRGACQRRWRRRGIVSCSGRTRPGVVASSPGKEATLASPLAERGAGSAATVLLGGRSDESLVSAPLDGTKMEGGGRRWPGAEQSDSGMRRRQIFNPKFTKRPLYRIAISNRDPNQGVFCKYINRNL